MEVPCEYIDDIVVYKCFVSNVKISNPNLINRFIGEHEENRNNNDVMSLTFESCQIQIFPQNLLKHFPNLTVLELISCDLTEITNEDLKFYPNLMYLGIVNNRLTHLSSDLFEYTPYIKYIDFSCNHIKSIGPRIFDSLKNLREVNFSENKHINVLYDKENRKFKFKHLLNLIKTKCRPMETLKEIAAGKLMELINDQNAIELFFYASRFDLCGLKKKAFLHIKSKIMPCLDDGVFYEDSGKLMEIWGLKL